MRRVLSVLFIAATLIVGVLANPAPAAAAEKAAQPQVEVLVLPAGQKLVQVNMPFVVTRPMLPTERPEVHTVYVPNEPKDGAPLEMRVLVVERRPEANTDKTAAAKLQELVIPPGRKLVSFDDPIFVTRLMKPGERPVTYTVGMPICDERSCDLRAVATIREQKK